MTREQVAQLRNEADKAIGKAKVLIDKVMHNVDPAINAELMHSLQQALLDLAKASELLSPVRGTITLLANELAAAKVEEEKLDHGR